MKFMLYLAVLLWVLSMFGVMESETAAGTWTFIILLRVAVWANSLPWRPHP